MKLLLDPSPDKGLAVTPTLEVLNSWYAGHSAVRRLWAIRKSQYMRVIVTLEPTHDGDDILPAWLAKAHEWARELQSRIDGPVQLEVADEPCYAGFGAGVDGLLVAALEWRDASVPQPPFDSSVLDIGLLPPAD